MAIHSPYASFQARVVRRAYFCAAYRDHLNQTVGRNYIVEAYVDGPIQADTGMVIGIRELDEVLQLTVRKLDHKYLNSDVPEFAERSPTAENLAQFCYQDMSGYLIPFRHLKLYKIRLYETDDLWIDYGPQIHPEI